MGPDKSRRIAAATALCRPPRSGEKTNAEGAILGDPEISCDAIGNWPVWSTCDYLFLRVVTSNFALGMPWPPLLAPFLSSLIQLLGLMSPLSDQRAGWLASRQLVPRPR